MSDAPESPRPAGQPAGVAPATPAPVPLASRSPGSPTGGAAGLPGGSSAGFGSPDWPAQATDSIVRAVDSVREKTAGPAISAATVAIYGLAIVLLVIPLSIWAFTAVMRVTEGLLQWVGDQFAGTWVDDLLAQPMWLVYSLYGVAFVLAGLLLWRKAKRAAPS